MMTFFVTFACKCSFLVIIIITSISCAMLEEPTHINLYAMYRSCIDITYIIWPLSCQIQVIIFVSVGDI